MEDLVGKYSVFIDLPYQIAWRRKNHRKFWNVIVHLVTAWWAAKLYLSMAKLLFPGFINVCLILLHIGLCVVQNFGLGAIYSILYFVVAFYGLSAETSFFQVLIMIILVIGFQILVGHFLIENDQPVILERQGDAIYVVCTILNDLFLSPYHFSVLIIMRANLLPNLQWKSDIQLKKLMEQMHGEKAP